MLLLPVGSQCLITQSESPGLSALLSPGTEFLLTEIEHFSHTNSTAAPSSEKGRKSTRMRCVSVSTCVKYNNRNFT